MIYLILALLCFGLVALLWAGTVWFQGYLYESVTAPDLYWRAPAAALALTAFFGLWCFLANNTPGSVPGLFQFSFSKSNLDSPYDKFWAVSGGKETLYTKQTTLKGSRPVREYRDAQTKTAWPPSSRPEALVVIEEGEKVRFEARQREGGTEYVDGGGRVITETDPGVYSLFSWGLLLKNFFLYVGLLVVWFLCLWLLLRFQWSHALGLAFVMWLVCVLLLVPLLVEQAEKRAAPATTTTAPSQKGDWTCSVETLPSSRRVRCADRPFRGSTVGPHSGPYGDFNRAGLDL